MMISLLSRVMRAPDMALRFCALVNTLFFASFLLVLTVAMGQARAEDLVCGGKDLRQTLAADKLKAAQTDAEATLNGDYRLWKIEKPGVEPSYLFGTMHMTDPRVIDLTPEARKAYEGSSEVIIETTDVLDEKISTAALLARPDLMMFTDATTLSSLVKPEQLAVLEDGLRKRGMPLVTVNKMKPWMIAGVLAMPACELKRKSDGAPFLDIKLAEDAKASGKPIDGLETMIEQLDSMAALPMDQHIESLVETAALGDEINDVMETMILLYTEGKIAWITPLLKQVAPAGLNGEANYADFEEIMIHARNVRMAERARKFLAKGNAFVAVGAMHLPGDAGLVELFRKDGYKLTALAP